jgi:hypothetical protein
VTPSVGFHVADDRIDVRRLELNEIRTIPSCTELAFYSAGRTLVVVGFRSRRSESAYGSC